MIEQFEWPESDREIMQVVYNIASEIGPQFASWPREGDSRSPTSKQRRRNVIMAILARVLTDFFEAYRERKKQGIKQKLDA